jgi:hypothetical protein
MLNAKRATAHVQNPVAATAPPPPVSSQAPASNGVPACTDVVGIARVVMQANPGLPPNALAAAVDQFQSAAVANAADNNLQYHRFYYNLHSVRLDGAYNDLQHYRWDHNLLLAG